jgi:hypothetical protein
LCLELIAGARRLGLDVSTEAYAYTAASTSITAATFDPGWQERLGISYPDLQWVETGERLTPQSFETFRKQGGLVIMHMIPEQIVDIAIASPLVIISSDGLPFTTGGEHPRGAGNFARLLGHYVREKKVLSLMEALAKISWQPARRLETQVPAMARLLLAEAALRLNRPVAGLSPQAADQLQRYAWPGNVRELSNVMERAVALARVNHTDVEDLPEEVRRALPSRAVQPLVSLPRARAKAGPRSRRSASGVGGGTGVAPWATRPRTASKQEQRLSVE